MHIKAILIIILFLYMNRNFGSYTYVIRLRFESSLLKLVCDDVIQN